MKKDPSKKPRSGWKDRVFGKLSKAFNRSARRDMKGVFRHTLKDLRRPKEILLFIGSSVLPGGWLGYGAYRVAKYKNGNGPVNDDARSKSRRNKMRKPRKGKPGDKRGNGGPGTPKT